LSIQDRFTPDGTEADVCVVGAGPVGIAVAIASAQAGLSVLLLEAGNEDPRPSDVAPSDEVIAEGRHAPIGIAVSRALGGTSAWWGGRCVPYDDIDFVAREYIAEARWPIDHKAISRWYAKASNFFGCGRAVFAAQASPVGTLRFDELERWASERNMGRLHRAQLANSPRIRLCLNCEVRGLRLMPDGSNVDALLVSDGQKIRARSYVLACGGLGTARLLLLLQAQWPRHFGSNNGVLGRFYTGHISGKIADLVLSNPAKAHQHDFFLLDGAYARRRFTIPTNVQLAKRIFNTVFWADNPPFHEAAHASGTLSLIWLALACPPLGRRLVSEAIRVNHVGPQPHAPMAHLANVVRQPLRVAGDLGRIVRERFLRPRRKPGLLLFNTSGRYALHFHAEQEPRLENYVRLSNRVDSHGLPQVEIAFNYGRKDVQSVITAHALLDENLRQSGQGKLVYHLPREERAASVEAQAGDGFHQTGLTRMGDTAATSVVNSDCAVYGIPNLFVASSGVFPSASQAAPTFAAVALGFRLADHLARTVGRTPEISSSVPMDSMSALS
jgi:choline dehydrogenase-like flavoprotein